MPRKSSSWPERLPWSSFVSGPWVPATKAVGVRGHVSPLGKDHLPPVFAQGSLLQRLD